MQDCLDGLGECDLAQLSSEELQVVAHAAHGRNLKECLGGSDLCDPAQLTAAEHQEIAAAAQEAHIHGRKPPN